MIPYPGSLLDYFLERVQPMENGCWYWNGSHTPYGYGRIRLRRLGSGYYAHRFSYEQFTGIIGLTCEIDHLCRNSGCVNPDHLEAVTHAENLRRGIIASSEKTTCPQGHIYDRLDILGRRFCHQCAHTAKRRYRERQRDKASAQ